MRYVPPIPLASPSGFRVMFGVRQRTGSLVWSGQVDERGPWAVGVLQTVRSVLTQLALDELKGSDEQ
jgi:hypothetical protein